MKKLSKNNLPQKPVNCFTKDGRSAYGNLLPDGSDVKCVNQATGETHYGIVAYETTTETTKRVKEALSK